MISIRPCRSDEGQAIAAFVEGKPSEGVEQHGVAMDWTQPVVSWMIAEEGEKIVGVVLLAIAPPIGFFESMVVDPQCSRGRVVAEFLETGYGILRAGGCSAACCFIPDAHEAWRTILKRRGARVVYRGEMLIRHL